MAFLLKNMSVLAYANGFTLWHYRTPDAASDVIAAGYFDPAAGMLHVGDIVLTNAGADTPTPETGLLAVAAVANAVVLVASLTAFGALQAGKAAA
jgi:hypothetical protein